MKEERYLRIPPRVADSRFIQGFRLDDIPLSANDTIKQTKKGLKFYPKHRVDFNPLFYIW